MSMRQDIIDMATRECRGISIRLADWLFAKFPPPWSEDVRRSLRRAVEFGIETAMGRELSLLTIEERVQMNTAIMEVFDARIADLTTRGSQLGHA